MHTTGADSHWGCGWGPGEAEGPGERGGDGGAAGTGEARTILARGGDALYLESSSADSMGSGWVAEAWR